MSVIEKFQKKVLFEEAAQKAIREAKFLSVTNVLEEIIGIRDIGEAKYGIPLTPFYQAKDGQPIDISRITAFFKGLVRDIKVLDLSVEEVEDQLLSFSAYFWNAMERIKRDASGILREIRTYDKLATTGGIWQFTDTFRSVDYIDMDSTTLWVDTAEGIAFLPSSSDSNLIRRDEFTIEDVHMGTAISMESSIESVFDMLPSTSWRVLFPSQEEVSFTLQFNQPQDILSIRFDPIGGGANVLVQVSAGKEDPLREVVRSTIYARSTFQISSAGVSQLRINFSPAVGQISGFREITLERAVTVKSGSLVSREIRSPVPFSRVAVEVDAAIPDGSYVVPYVSFDGGDSWHKSENPEKWIELGPRTIITVPLPGSASVGRTGGLYKVPVSPRGVSKTTGTLSLGNNQFEIAAARLGSQMSLLTDIPLREHMERGNIRETWAYVPSISVNTSSVIAQPPGSDITVSHGITRGEVIVFSRKLEQLEIGELVFLPFLGDGYKDLMQGGFLYRFKVLLLALADVAVEGLTARMLQGYRQVGSRGYRDIGRSYGAYSIYLNGEFITGSRTPSTIYADGSLDRSYDSLYDLRLRRGWNVLEIYILTRDLKMFQPDQLEVEGPYLQISLQPDMFDPEFRRRYRISRVVGTGDLGPVSSHDLSWGLPTSLRYWAWDDLVSGVLFNVNPTVPTRIDGVFSGNIPDATFSYVSGPDEASSLLVRLDAARSHGFDKGPIIRSYTVRVS